jgi:predicted CoA-binding protein
LIEDGLDDREIRRILTLKNVAVVGASRDPSKPSHLVPKYLMDHGYNIVPVSPSAPEIFGKKCYSNKEAVDDARKLGITVVWNRCMMKEHRRLFSREP